MTPAKRAARVKRAARAGRAARGEERRVGRLLAVGGTSAGAATTSSTMLIGGPSEGTVRRCDVELAPGLGLGRDTVVDTHSSPRGRVSRILTLHASNPQVLFDLATKRPLLPAEVEQRR